MDLLGTVDPGVVSADALTGLTLGIIKVLGYGALGIVLVGFLASCLCDLLECRRMRRDQGRGEGLRMAR